VDFTLVGRFFYRNNGDTDKLKFTFIPHLDFIDSGRFSFPQNESNISPLSKKVPKLTSIKISLGAISSQCEYDREIVASILKDVMVLFIKHSRAGKEVILDLKIGILHAYPNGELQFENYDTEQA